MRARRFRLGPLLAALLAGGFLGPASIRAGDPPPPPPVPAPVPSPAPAPGKPIEVPDASPWLDAAGPRVVGVSTDGSKVFFTNRVKGVVQLFVTDADGKTPRQLTSRAQSLSFAVPSPDGSKVVVGYDKDGDENTALFLLDLGAEKPVEFPLAGKPGVQCGSVVWTPEGDRIYFRSNDRDRASFSIHERSLDASGHDETVLEPDGSWRVEDASRGGESLLLVRERSNRDAALFLLHLKSHSLVEIHPNVEGPTSAVGKARFLGNGPNVLFIQEFPWWDNYAFADAWVYEAATGACWRTTMGRYGGRYVCTALRIGVDDVAATHDGSRIYVHRAAYQGAKGSISIADAAMVEELNGLAGALEYPSGELAGLCVDRRGRIFASRSSPDDPGSIVRWDSERDAPATIVSSTLGLLAPSALPEEPKWIQFATRELSGDFTMIDGWLWLPKGKEPRNLPFILSIHGGPEGEDRPGWHPDRAYLLSLGFGVLAPNVRGSTGHGRLFRDADDGRKRMDSVRDAKAAADWLVAKGYADPKRLGVMGGSYGGFMVLALLTEFPETFAAGAESVGISNFETFLEKTAPYRRALREAEYGSLSDREFLRSISPIHKVDRIRAPLLIAHGENDPRVPVGEARQIEAELRRLGRPVETLYFADEGHGWKKPENRRKHLETVARFFLEHLGPR